jgi:hypothetical protein
MGLKMKDLITGLFVCCFLSLNALVAQDFKETATTNEWAVRSGYMEYNNSTVIPSGLPGFSTSINYYFQKRLSEVYPYNFEFQTKLIYGYLMKPEDNNGLNKPYHHAEMSVGALWSYSIPVSKLNIDVGGGLLFNALAGYNPSFKFNDNYFAQLQPYGNWLLMPSTTLGLQYQFNKIKLKSKFIFPLCVGGFYQDYQNYPYLENNIPSYISTPNTLAFCNKYTAIFAEMDCYIPLSLSSKRKTDLKIGFYIDNTNGSINYIVEKKRNIGIIVGVQIK